MDLATTAATESESHAPQPVRPSLKRRWLRIALLLLALIAIVSVAGVVYIRRNYRVYYIPAESMEPTLMGHDKGFSQTGFVHADSVHDRILVDLRFYSTRPIRHGDIIAFRAPARADLGAEMAGKQPAEKDLAKRVIGVPGDRIHIREDQKGIVRVYRNGTPLDESYLNGPMSHFPNASYGTDKELKVGPKELFVMGDNRNNSNDSRFWGPLERGRVIGKVTAILAPADRATDFP